MALLKGPTASADNGSHLALVEYSLAILLSRSEKVHPKTDRLISMDCLRGCEVMQLLLDHDADYAPPSLRVERFNCDNGVDINSVDSYTQQLPALLDGHPFSNGHQLEHLHGQVGARLNQKRRTVRGLVYMICGASATTSTSFEIVLGQSISLCC